MKIINHFKNRVGELWRQKRQKRVIRHGFLRDFPIGFYNGVFQFISKIKPVLNIT